MACLFLCPLKKRPVYNPRHYKKPQSGKTEAFEIPELQRGRVCKQMLN